MEKVDVKKNTAKRITVAAAIILNEAGELLAVRKKNTNVFMQVGGKLEAIEPPEHAIAREIKEEIGCDIQIDQF
ncbi:NUDIX domain-containing protein, partial [Acinetobacter ursingii]|uniref:NUDIX domain-containing protein n=1 Tax=Acinetobacter ursingii TaxID=108980 RepID=UPI003AF4B642